MSLVVSERQEVRFERGFKSWAENTAVSIRRRLKLKDIAPLPPRLLADDLGVVVWYPQDVPGISPKAVRHLGSREGDEWSAVTVCAGGQEAVVLNPSHSEARQASDLMHELAHLIRGHVPGQVYVLPEAGIGLRSYNALEESEANWLAGCLLLPRPALAYCASRKIDFAEICAQYGVSQDLVRYRMNVSGVNRQFRR